MDVDYYLERISKTGEKDANPIKIDKSIFTCGRSKESNLVCLSLLVSRQHCHFTKSYEGLFVTDLGSSNGVFVNNNMIKPKQALLLHNNDTIGIGCNLEQLYIDNNSVTLIYRLKIRPRTTCDEKPDNEISKVENNQIKPEREKVPNNVEKLSDKEDDCVEIVLINDEDEKCSTDRSNSVKQIQPDGNPKEKCPSKKSDTVNVEIELTSDDLRLNSIAKEDKLLSKSDTVNAEVEAAKDIVVKKEPEPEDLISSIQEEIHWGCSQSEVEVSNDDVFQASQLFDKTIKKEQSEVEENESVVYPFEEEDIDIITIDDSDDDNDELIRQLTDATSCNKIQNDEELFLPSTDLPPEEKQTVPGIPVEDPKLKHVEPPDEDTSKKEQASSSTENKKRKLQIIEPLPMPSKAKDSVKKNKNAIDPNYLYPKSHKDKKRAKEAKKRKNDEASKEDDASKSKKRLHANHESETRKDSKKSSPEIQEKVSSLDDKQSKGKLLKNVKVKVSKKTRADMLCEEMINEKRVEKPIVKEKENVKQQSNANTVPASKETIFTSFVIPRRVGPPTNSTSNNKPYPSTSSVLSDVDTTNDSSTVPLTPSDVGDTSDDNSTANKQMSANSKRVSFRENIVSVKEYPIDPGNQLKNINSKISGKTMYGNYEWMKRKGTELKVEDFLTHIFQWEPIWLEQQQFYKKLPPLIKPEDLQPLLTEFETYEDYYKRMKSLLYLEVWQQMFKEFECTGQRYKKSVSLSFSILPGSIEHTNSPPAKYTTMVINITTTQMKARSDSHPIFGDLIIIEYCIKPKNANEKEKSFKSFGYVTDARLQFVKKPNNSVVNPEMLLVCTIKTRNLGDIFENSTCRLRSIFYLRPYLRLVQALQYLPRSSLMDAVLKVDVDEFQLDKLSTKEVLNYKLITMEKLNDMQLNAVIKFTNAAVQMRPKIGLLMGPPGTGKSKVIVNLVTQILYGDNRYVQNQIQRILICAPSNAAIDEIVLRLMEIRAAIKDHRFKMVRIGQTESMHEEVRKISLAELSRIHAQRIYADQQHKFTEDAEREKQKLRNDIAALESLIDSNPQNEIYKKDLYEAKTKFQKLTTQSPEEEAAKFKRHQNLAKNQLLSKADVIACTLSSCYNGTMEAIFGPNTNSKIATCIVDEATQSSEAETLIPLMLGVKCLILVGDPNQLPATITSPDAKKLGLDRSLFTRIKESFDDQCQQSEDKNPVMMLNCQYRMVTSISYWPNKFFYSGKLHDQVPSPKNFPLHPYRVLNLDGIQDGSRFSNPQEAEFIGNLINCIMKYSNVVDKKKISLGIITPYQNQKSLISNKIIEQTSNIPEVSKNKFLIEVNTIDSFQGQERDVIIMSCVRSDGIGFLSDPQRLCVALTRAKLSLILCGNFSAFQKDVTWNNLLNDACSRGLLLQISCNSKPQEIKQHVIRI